MALTTEAGLAAAILDGKRVRFAKGAGQGTAGQMYSLFRQPGFPLGATGTPASTGVQLSRSSGGALPIPAASGTSYLAEWEGAATTACCMVLADRLVEFGGLSGIVTTAQAVSALALPARASAATDVELWLEVYTAAGATAIATVTASYTNQSGTAGRTATLTGGLIASALATANRTFQFSLQAGDTGVQSVQSLTLGTSSGTAGNIGLVLRRSMVTGWVPNNCMGFYQSWGETDLQIAADDACLEVMFLGSGATPSTIHGAVRVAQG